MNQSISILWFRRDLRLEDNPALIEASKFGTVLPIYIFHDVASEGFKIGARSKNYLMSSLESLNKSLNKNLNIYFSDPVQTIVKVAKTHGAKTVFANRLYESWEIQLEKEVEQELQKFGVTLELLDSCYLYKPEEVVKNDGSYYKVFSAYKKKALSLPPRAVQNKPAEITFKKDISNEQLKTTEALEPASKLNHTIDCGEDKAMTKLEQFIKSKLSGYKKGRDFPGLEHTSTLSPSLHFGEISPNQIFELVCSQGRKNAGPADVECFISQLLWREFSCYLMFHFPELHYKNFKAKFDQLPWQKNDQHLQAWQQGLTGYPLVDAGMRELLQTGYMHNRVRMVVASFLVKNLAIVWHSGRDWFWEKLFDADLANNSANWQWVAGCGTDAAPYFRIFNPTTQGEKFDQEGLYTRKFVPELAGLPNKYLFEPSKAPKDVLEKAGVVLGRNYPTPIVDLKTSRARALADYKKIKGKVL